MCSGCAGDYSGGFEENGGCGSDGAPWSNGLARPVVNGNLFEDEETGSFEDSLNPHGSSAPANLAPSRSAGATEISEILVSATNLLEVRVIAVKSEEMRWFRGTKGRGYGCSP